MATPKKKSNIIQEIVEVDAMPITKISNGRQAIEFKISEEAKNIIEEFKENLVGNNKASTTVKSYIFDVNSFISYIESVGIVFTGEFNTSQYSDFIKTQIELKVKPNTINKRINSLQQFNIYLLLKKYMKGVIIISKNDRLPIN
ncbi:phage integrase N-terminal SAM-like domain-containing protein [Clostridium sp. CF012]|uniref:phage integrase N-terminal SAM-like domain-containing protein n=1 Tax=Clostridium sp. CF012 TaxID=2843319 RepID=UPI001C0ADF3B|nr:phage integrase N-terminal SAM-like domain-containing protein [Clostridium sp. CF012]MBU3144618.1 phage integrase N-terminal SAM-like domain-containing protein [Clostridium sp. CF012]